ncbi:hypothetical protein SPHINGO391_210023 [Sphingomonas aurantiaca]|uniref:Uncharacterized protein n=1 Tax=Sphingomonas aurantiaca TaxID=185949 RepID=A0A5E7Y013_9SPHN|nr:hypothetical protein SPHINGO391_210023 [Sphingomonas aurantiaca]
MRTHEGTQINEIWRDRGAGRGARKADRYESSGVSDVLTNDDEAVAPWVRAYHGAKQISDEPELSAQKAPRAGVLDKT